MLKHKEYQVQTATTLKKTGLSWLWLSIFVIIIDQVTKYLAISYLTYNQSHYLLPILNLILEYNTGAAFNFLSEMGRFAIWLFIISAFIISLVLCIWMSRLSVKNYWLGIGLSLILGGAIGNLLDRIFYGYVIDFLHLHFGHWSLFVFNIADTAITFGAIMLIIDIFRKK